jgi:hypothetical protein
MKRSGLYLIASLAIAIGSVHCSFAQPQRVIIIRHGEKPDQGENLSCQGLNRALELPPVLHQKVGTPSAIYVPSINQGKSTGVARMYQTIVPFAIRYNLNVSTKYEVDDAQGLANAIKKQQGTVLVVWEHKQAGKILKALGVATKEKWPDDDFDSMWIVTFKNGVASFSKDSEGLHPPANCQ